MCNSHFRSSLWKCAAKSGQVRFSFVSLVSGVTGDILETTYRPKLFHMWKKRRAIVRQRARTGWWYRAFDDRSRRDTREAAVSRKGKKVEAKKNCSPTHVTGILQARNSYGTLFNHCLSNGNCSPRTRNDETKLIFVQALYVQFSSIPDTNFHVIILAIKSSRSCNIERAFSFCVRMHEFSSHPPREMTRNYVSSE